MALVLCGFGLLTGTQVRDPLTAEGTQDDG